MLVTGFCFLGVTITVRYTGSGIPAAEAAFIRYLVGTLFLVPVYYRIIRGSTVVPLPGIMTVRGVAHGLGVILWFYAMARIPMAQVTALGYLTPVVVTVGAALFLGEVLHLRRLVAVTVGFVGMLVILRPGFTEISLGQIAQLLTTPLFAVSMLLTKRLSAEAEPAVIVASLSLVCTLTLLPLAMINWVTPTLTEVALLSLTAVFATYGHYTMTLAFRNAPLTALQPISFLQLLWATIAGILLFDEGLDIYVVIGGGILVLSATYIAHRESVINRAEREEAVRASD
ncbi:peptide ABC transporter permease [Chromatiales bacterium (ex Bugula neritina AB1)]|nr:peptide ABC transporter permease [Chromatiales bacterium (ex Bugula neritina AB1)]